MSINACAIDLLNQLSLVVDGLSKEDFKRKVPVLSLSSIGQHVRHTLEFFLCMMDAQNQGSINYDKRKHDKFLEEDKHLALSVISSIKEFLRRHTSNFPISMAANYHLQSDTDIIIETNFHRELAYNIEHAIHHMALIKIGVGEVAEDLILPAHFGVASSTVRFHSQN